MKQWFKIDNAGLFYPSLISSRITTLFRLSATVDHRIKVKELQEALNLTLHRYPFFKVQLKAGAFWYYFEENPHEARIEQDSLYPCMKMPIKKVGMFPFRVRAYYNRVALEISHALTDGTGALCFFKTLLTEYFRLLGMDLPKEKLTDEILIEETEDSFKKYYNPEMPPPIRGNKAFHVPWKAEKKGIYHIMTGILPVSRIKEEAKKKNVSITEYLLAVLGIAFQSVYDELPERQKKRRKFQRPFRLMVPVNLRSIFPSKTMRNFFLSIEPSFNPTLGDYSFDEILNIVHHFMRVEVNEKYIQRQITRNVKGERSTRGTPLFLKNIVLKILYTRMGESRYSSSISNMGKVDMPEELKDRILRFEMVPPPSPLTKIKCGVISWKDELVISFGSIVEETDLEKHFFRTLRKQGIPVEIETNRKL